jgi:hypothetical protein
MLSKEQKRLLNAFGKAQMQLKSFAVVAYDFGNDDSDYLVLSCEELWESYRCRNENHKVISWMHPYIVPDWESLDISEDDYSDYMERRFPLMIRKY